MIPFLQKSCSRLNTWVEYLLFTIGLSMALLVAAQVFFRYVLNNSLFWSEELARYMLAWISFLGATSAYYRGVHPGVDVVVTRLGLKTQQMIRFIVHLISVAFFTVITVAGFQFAYFVRLQISPALGIQKWAILAVIPVSGIILICYGVTFLLSIFQEMAHDQ